MPEKPPEVAVGEEWAYRARAIDELVQVRVVRVGTSRPIRVLVRFMDDEFEGREEWIPPNRLKALWTSAPEWIARENRWEAVRDASWCGEEAVDRFDELEALRAEVLRVGQVAERAIRELDAEGGTKAAERLRQELGVSVELLRASQTQGRRLSSGP